MERTSNRSSVIVIYWQTRNRKTIQAIVERFNLSANMSINRETECVISNDDLPLLRECEERGFIQLRKNNDYEKRINP